MSPNRGPVLPYSVVVGVTPWSGGWLAVSAKMAGSTFAPESPRIYSTFLEIVNERPAFSAIVVNAPIGYLDTESVIARTCDREARFLVGRRGSTVHNAPNRAILAGEVPWNEVGLDAVSATFLPQYQEVAAEMSPFRQRVIFEGHPELSFYQLRRDTPLSRSKQIEAGRDERRDVLEEKIPGIQRVLDAPPEGVPVKHVFDASALLWTARRVLGHAAQRIPVEGEWDSEGLRMEIVY